MRTETTYKIRNVYSGLYSTGGTTPSFSKKGKEWKRIGDLKCHLGQLQSWRRHDPYKDCELIELTKVIQETESAKPLSQFLQEIENQKMKKEREAEERYNKRIEAQERAELKRLREKYEQNS